MREELCRAFDLTYVNDSAWYHIQPGAHPDDLVRVMIINPSGIEDAMMTIKGRPIRLREALEGTQAPYVILPDGNLLLVEARRVFEMRQSEPMGFCHEEWSCRRGLITCEKREFKRRGRPRGSFTYDTLMGDIVAAMADTYQAGHDLTLERVADYMKRDPRDLRRCIARQRAAGTCLDWQTLRDTFKQVAQESGALPAKHASSL